jgi:hypothetical protein
MPTTDAAPGCRIANELDRSEQPLPLETLEGKAVDDVVVAVGYVLDILEGVADLVEDVDDVAADALEGMPDLAVVA